jgi:hypothetical protein
VPGIAYNATFSFSGFAGQVTGISVEAGTPELVDMTAANTPAGHAVMVPTGDFKPGSISVDFLADAPPPDTGTVGPLTFNSSFLSVSRNVVLESAQVEARVGELVRGTMKFTMTDYSGS